MSGQDPGRMLLPLLPHPAPATPVPQPSHCEGPRLKVHRMQLTVSPRQDEGILLQKKEGWGQKRMSSQNRERGRIKI